MTKIDLSQFPETGTFDFPAIGFGLTRDKVKEITDTWTPDELAAFAKAYPNKVTTTKVAPTPVKKDEDQK